MMCTEEGKEDSTADHKYLECEACALSAARHHEEDPSEHQKASIMRLERTVILVMILIMCICKASASRDCCD